MHAYTTRIRARTRVPYFRKFTMGDSLDMDADYKDVCARSGRRPAKVRMNAAVGYLTGRYSPLGPLTI
jgi:hypothetical protein